MQNNTMTEAVNNMQNHAADRKCLPDAEDRMVTRKHMHVYSLFFTKNSSKLFICELNSKC